MPLPSLPLPPTALTSDSHTVGFLAIRSSSSSVQLGPRSWRTVASADCPALSPGQRPHPQSSSQTP